MDILYFRRYINHKIALLKHEALNIYHRSFGGYVI